MQVKMYPGKSAIILLVLFSSTQTAQDLRRAASYRASDYRANNDHSMTTMMQSTRNGEAILSCDRSGTRCVLDENYSRFMERKPDIQRRGLDSRRSDAIRSDDRMLDKRDTQFRISDPERISNDRRVFNDNRNRIRNIDTHARSDRSREKLKEDMTRVSDVQTRNRVMEGRKIDQIRDDMGRRTIPENSERRMINRINAENKLSDKYTTLRVIRDSHRQPFRDNQRQISRTISRSNHVSVDVSRRYAIQDMRENRDAKRVLSRYRSALGRSDTSPGSNPGTNLVDSRLVRHRRDMDIERLENRISTIESKNRRNLRFTRNNRQGRDAPVTVENLSLTETQREFRVRASSERKLSSRIRLSRASDDIRMQPERIVSVQKSRRTRDSDITQRSTLSSRRNLQEDTRISKKSENVQRTSRLSSVRRNREDEDMIRSTVHSYSRARDIRSNQANSFVRNDRIRSSRQLEKSRLSPNAGEIKDSRMIPLTDRMLVTRTDDQHRFLKERTIIERPDMRHPEYNRYTLVWMNTLQIILGLYLIGEMFGTSKKIKKGFLQLPRLGLSASREKVN